jgi:hypothetical protein
MMYIIQKSTKRKNVSNLAKKKLLVGGAITILKNMSSSMGRMKTHLRGGTRRVGEQERNRRKNEGERAREKT